MRFAGTASWIRGYAENDGGNIGNELAVLSGLSVAELNQAILLQDVKRLTRVPGIGNKTAE